jgi:hypothetical protein
VDANDEARSPISPNTVASIAPGKSASILDASCANETGKYNIHPYPRSSELLRAKASLINATTTATPQPATTTTQLNDKNDNRGRCVGDVLLACDSEITSDIEIALACAEIDLTKRTATKEKIRRKITWKVPCARYAYNPPETQDKKEAYRQYLIQGKFSISKVLPEERPWIPADQWITYPRKAHARKHYNDEGRAKWKERHLASRRMKENAMYHLAQAKRSALIMSLDIDVGTGTLPKKWPAVSKRPERYTYGLCDLPPLEDIMTQKICYANEPPARSFIAQITQIPAVNPANALMAAQVTEIPAANPVKALTAAQVTQIPVLNTANEWMAVKDVNVDTRDNQVPFN